MAVKGEYVYEWPRAMVTVDAAVFGFFGDEVFVLLIRRGHEPFKGKWAIPGGFVEMDEELADAAARELAEETGLVGVELEQIHTFGGLGRDPRGRQITVVYMGVVGEKPAGICGGDDADDARWFNIDRLDEIELGFDHEQVIGFAVKELGRRYPDGYCG